MIKLKNLLIEEFEPYTPFSTKDPASNGKKVWNTNDPWEYYLDKDTQVWWTRKRGLGGDWLDMKARISDERYKQAMATLDAYIAARKKIEGDGSSKSSTTSTKSDKTATTASAPEKSSPMKNAAVDVRTPEVRGKETVDADEIEMKEKPIEAGQRNYNVRVLSQTEDGEYLEVRLPKRGILNRKPVVYVKASDFNVSADGTTATYNKNSGEKFNIYKAKRKRNKNTEE